MPFNSRTLIACALFITPAVFSQPLVLDTGRLVSDPQVTPATVTDNIWTLTPPAGRKLYLLPFRIAGKVDQPTPLETTTRLTGGQFVGWYIPQSPHAAPSPTPAPAPRPVAPTPGPGLLPPGLQIPRTLPNGQPIPENIRRQLESGQIPDAVRQEMQRRGIALPQGGPGAQPAAAVPVDVTGQYDKSAPRLAREASLLPDGQVSWKLARGLPNAQVTSKNHLYGFMVSREAMPPAPEQRLIRGAGPQVNQQREAAQAEYKAARETHLALTKAIRELPEEFTEPAPEVVYAIYIAQERMPNFSLTGDAPLPWSVKTPDFEMLRGLAKNAAEQPLTDALEWLTGDSQPFSLRVAAALVSSGNNLSKVKPDGLLMPVVMRVVKEGDSFDRLLLVRAIAEGNQSVPIAGTILNSIMQDPDSDTALMALRARAGDAQRQRDALQPDDVRLFASTTQRLLAADSGPDAGQVIAPALDLAKQNEPARETLAAQLDFKPVRGARLESLVRVVVDKARDKDPLALMLLDRQLLGSEQNEVVQITLNRVIGDSPAASPSGAPGTSLLSRLGSSLGFGGSRAQVPAAQPRPGLPAPTQPPQPPRPIATPFSVFDRLESLNTPPNPASPPGFPGVPGFPSPGGYAPAQPPQPKGPDPIEINHPRHGMILALQTKDAVTRELAWKALPSFALGQPVSRGAASEFKAQDTYISLAEAATQLDPTPPQVIAFLEQQKDTAGVEAAYRKLMTDGQGEVRIQALTRFASGNNSNLSRVLTEMSAEDRIKVVSLWYESGSVPPPLSAGLLHQSEKDGEPGPIASKLVTWISQEIVAGRRPLDAQWSANVGGTQTLIPGLGDQDETFAMGCAAALWASVLPVALDSVQQLREKAAEIMRSAPTPNEGHTQVEAAWKTTRDEAIKQYLESATGRYTLQVAAHSPPQQANNPYGTGPLPGGFPPQPGARTGRPGQSMARPINRKLEIDLGFESPGKVAVTPYDITGQLVEQTAKIQFSNSSQLLNPKIAEPPAAQAAAAPPVPGAPGAPTPPGPFPGPVPGGFPSAGGPRGQPIELSPVAVGRWEGTAVLPDQRVMIVVLIKVPDVAP